MSNKFMKLTDMNLEHVAHTGALTPTIEEVKRRMAQLQDEPEIGRGGAKVHNKFI